MAISSVGNLVYINQNAQAVANTQSAIQHRNDVANLTNMQDFQEKLESVEEVKKLEENEVLNPDRDAQKQQHQKQENTQKEQEECVASEHLLDVRA